MHQLDRSQAFERFYGDDAELSTARAFGVPAQVLFLRKVCFCMICGTWPPPFDLIKAIVSWFRSHGSFQRILVGTMGTFQGTGMLWSLKFLKWPWWQWHWTWCMESWDRRGNNFCIFIFIFHLYHLLRGFLQEDFTSVLIWNVGGFFSDDSWLPWGGWDMLCRGSLLPQGSTITDFQRVCLWWIHHDSDSKNLDVCDVWRYLFYLYIIVLYISDASFWGLLYYWLGFQDPKRSHFLSFLFDSVIDSKIIA